MWKSEKNNQESRLNKAVPELETLNNKQSESPHPPFLLTAITVIVKK